MAKPKVIVDRVRSVSRADLLPGVSLLPKGANFAVVRLTNSTVLLDLNAPTGRPWERILDEFRLLDIPVYLEVDAEKNVILKILRPRLVFVSKVASEPDKLRGHRVDLEISSAVHYVSPKNEFRETLLEKLRAAQLLRAPVLVTENLRNTEIIDVRPDPRPFAGAKKKPEPEPRPEQLARIGTVSPAEAANLFDLITAQVHIPFAYPDNGCWVRAHEMVRLMDPTSVPLQKAWLYGPPNLSTATSNSPVCSVTWSWHVAPCVDVQDGVNVVPHVIDPSLFTSVVTRTAWVNALAPTATLQMSSPSIYYRILDASYTELDDDYSKTQLALDALRLDLEIRISCEGPPPYSCP